MDCATNVESDLEVLKTSVGEEEEEEGVEGTGNTPGVYAGRNKVSGGS